MGLFNATKETHVFVDSINIIILLFINSLILFGCFVSMIAGNPGKQAIPLISGLSSDPIAR